MQITTYYLQTLRKTIKYIRHNIIWFTSLTFCHLSWTYTYVLIGCLLIVHLIRSYLFKNTFWYILYFFMIHFLAYLYYKTYWHLSWIFPIFSHIWKWINVKIQILMRYRIQFHVIRPVAQLTIYDWWLLVNQSLMLVR